uniref:Putative secreted protein n=1 Tax=Amblyomma parvum TaxID=251391 RepID=A0A023G083_AMBPA
MFFCRNLSISVLFYFPPPLITSSVSCDCSSYVKMAWHGHQPMEQDLFFGGSGTNCKQKIKKTFLLGLGSGLVPEMVKAGVSCEGGLSTSRARSTVCVSSNAWEKRKVAQRTSAKYFCLRETDTWSSCLFIFLSLV